MSKNPRFWDNSQDLTTLDSAATGFVYTNSDIHTIDLLKIIDDRLDSFLRPEKGQEGSVTVRTSTFRFLPSFAHCIENITKQKPDFCGQKA